MEHKQIILENGTVHYWIHRHADHSMFERQVPYFASDCTVITWDVPLHGLSMPYENFSYRQSAMDLKAILDREHIESAVHVGMSMGGYVSQMFADLFPDRTEGFVALDTTPLGHRYYSKLDVWTLQRVGAMAKWFPGKTLRKSIARASSKTAYSYQKMLEMLKPHTKAQIIEQMEIAYGGFVRENREIALACPVLILLGDSDTTGKVRQYCRAWAAHTGYPLHVIRNAAHFSNGDNAEQVNEEIASFIRGL